MHDRTAIDQLSPKPRIFYFFYKFYLCISGSEKFFGHMSATVLKFTEYNRLERSDSARLVKFQAQLTVRGPVHAQVFVRQIFYNLVEQTTL